MALSTMAFQARNNADYYWRLNRLTAYGNTDLRKICLEGGYSGKKTAVKDELVRCGMRMQRRLLCYYRCTKEELRRFAVDRQLVRQSNEGPVGVKGLIALLEAADDELRFERLEDLPPELRILIYEFYMAAFPRLDAPAQPPVTKVSRLLRREALPVFYGTCVFDLHLDGYGSRADRVVHRMTNRSILFLAGLSKDSCAEMRHLRIMLRGHLLPQYARIRLSLGEFPLGYEVDVKLLRLSSRLEYKAGDPKLKDAVKKECERVLAGVVARDSEGKAKLQLNDIYALRRGIETGCQ